MLPPAPPRFSMTTGWPRASPSWGAISRASASVPPPTANGTTSLTTRSGNCWAAAGSASRAREAAAATRTTARQMGVEVTACLRRDEMSRFRAASRTGRDRGLALPGLRKLHVEVPGQHVADQLVAGALAHHFQGLEVDERGRSLVAVVLAQPVVDDRVGDLEQLARDVLHPELGSGVGEIGRGAEDGKDFRAAEAPPRRVERPGVDEHRD